MKKLLAAIIGTLLFLFGALLALYPFISNYLTEQNQDSEIIEQQSAVSNTDEEIIEREFAMAEAYNNDLLGNVVIDDPFASDAPSELDEEYYSILNINNDSIMAAVEIPHIGVKIPVYHGTSDEVLQKGSGHLQKTSLPIGGKGTHAVLTGHTGLSTAKLFTDLNQLEEGDVFYIYVLNRTLAYEVDRISVIEPTDTSCLKIDPNEDYVTLMTCTPYGTNTHRLLVRGTRIPYEQAKETAAQTTPAESTWMKEYKRALIIGAIIFFSVLFVFIVIKIRLKKHSVRVSGQAD